MLLSCNEIIFLLVTIYQDDLINCLNTIVNTTKYFIICLKNSVQKEVFDCMTLIFYDQFCTKHHVDLIKVIFQFQGFVCKWTLIIFVTVLNMCYLRVCIWIASESNLFIYNIIRTIVKEGLKIVLWSWIKVWVNV